MCVSKRSNYYEVVEASPGRLLSVFVPDFKCTNMRKVTA